MTFSAAELAERRNFIGASECAAALGLSPFFSSVELYLDKIGQGTPIDETIPMMVGTALEPVTIALFERETGHTVSQRQHKFVDPTTAWRRASVDGMAEDGWIVEAKTSGDFRGWGDGDDEIPEHYLFNAAHSLACVPDAPGVYFPVLVGGRTYKHYRVKRDEDLIELVRAGEANFMELVATRKPPEPTSVDDVKRLYPRDNGQGITATPEIERLALEVAKLKAQAKQVEEATQDALTQICSFLGPYSTLRRVSLIGALGTPLATWNSQDENRVDPAALRANYPDVAKAVTKQTTIRKYLNKVKV
jgi:putative phage-type endonuclease